MISIELPGEAIVPTGGRAPRPKLLVVDDDPLVRRLVERTIGKDYETLQAADGAEALEVARRDRPDLIILDIRMPGMNGYEFLRRLRRESGLERARVIVLSAYANAARTDRSPGEARADAYLAKPFSPLELLTLVDEVLAA